MAPLVRNVIGVAVAAVAGFAVVAVDGRKIPSERLAVGEWNLCLHCSPEHLETELFPRAAEMIAADDDATATAPLKRRRQRRRRYDCRLAVRPNGTFLLSPPSDSVSTSATGKETTEDDNDDINNNDTRLLAIRGRWKLRSDPYCPTDRFYDDLVLVSFPRVQTRRAISSGQVEQQRDDTPRHDRRQRKLKQRIGDTIKNKAVRKDQSGSSPSKVVLKRLQFDLRCRLTGHYSRNRRRDPSRISRGVLVRCLPDVEADEEKNSSLPWWNRRRRRVVATFAGRRAIAFSPYQ